MTGTLPGLARAAQPGSRAIRRYWIAAALAGVALVLAVGWAGLGILAAVEQPASFPRAELPGSTSVTLPAGATRIVYYEGSVPSAAAALGLTVHDPAGKPVATTPYSRDVRYDAPQGSIGTAVASFTAGKAGTYRVSTRRAVEADARLAVGPDLGRDVVDQLLGPAILAATAVAAAAVALARLAALGS